MQTEPRFIVAEVSKTWVRGAPISDSPLISQSFEQCINVNYERGYRLYSFFHNTTYINDDEMNETIVAVFERIADAQR